MDLQSTVKQALTALFHHPEDAVRMDADRWLQDFQRTIDAWQVADNLLHDATSNLETLIFCSPTLRSKVQRDFEELPSEAFLPLQDSLNEVFNYKIAARSERRSQFERQLTSEIEVALNVLTACLNFNELKEQVLDAFASWLRLRHGIPGVVLTSHPLVLTALSSLKSDILSEAAVNVVSELIHYSSRGSVRGFSQHMPLIQVVVPQVMSLQPQLRDPSKDEEDVKAVARLFSDMGDSYVELIGTAHPEYDIASMTFNFWHSLQVTLTKRDSYVSFGDEMSIEAERKRRLQVFRSSYESLVSLVIFRIQYPQDYQELTHENLKDFRHTRFGELSGDYCSFDHSRADFLK